MRVAGGGSRDKGENPGVPALVMAAEHYNRLLRLVERGRTVELEMDVRARFHDEDPWPTTRSPRSPARTSAARW